MPRQVSHQKCKIALLTAAAGILFSSTLTTFGQEPKVSKLNIPKDATPINRAIAGASFAPMLEQATKSVVSVQTAELIRSVNTNGSSLEDILQRRLYGQHNPKTDSNSERKIPQGVGSGVIISSDGYIMTNNHVVQDRNGGDADEIRIRLHDNTELEAKLIGRDPKSDIAIIKVDASDLPAAPIADSDQTQVGDKVFAIGNPLGIGMTVTSGIISAKNRSIGIYGVDGYENFIQTDASINQGNSGGALVDIKGRLIGINSAIISGNGGSVGLGFAIPTNLAANIAEQLSAHGEVRRGLIGVRISPLDNQIAEALDIKGTKGVLVEQVEMGWPADKAGIKHGDIITHINTKAIENPSQLRLSIGNVTPGDTLKVKVLRDKKSLEKIVTVIDPNTLVGSSTDVFYGAKIQPITDTLRAKYNLPLNLKGIIIDKIARDSALYGRLAPGTVIMEINRVPVASIEEVKRSLKKGTNLLYIYSNGRTSYVAYKE